MASQVEVYDSGRVNRMGWDEGYMGTFCNWAEAEKFIEEFPHWEGEPIIEEIS